MKNPYLLPALTALIGFTIAWIAKPGGSPAEADPVAAQTETVEPKRPLRTQSGARGAAADNRRPTEVRASDFPLSDQAERGPQNREEAKMLRLTEALDLSIDQQGAIIALIENIQVGASDSIPVIEDLVVRGKAVEQALADLLSPAQYEKFQEIRVRERENRAELRAQQKLTEVIAEIDLSPEQREDVLARLRQKAKADLQSIPAAATLFLDKSILPTGNKELPVEGVLLLSQLPEPLHPDDPVKAQQAVIDFQRAELEEILRCFDGILTPGQMGQYQAALAETKAILNRLPQNLPDSFDSDDSDGPDE